MNVCVWRSSGEYDLCLYVYDFIKLALNLCMYVNGLRMLVKMIWYVCVRRCVCMCMACLGLCLICACMCMACLGLCTICVCMCTTVLGACEIRACMCMTVLGL